MYKDFYLFALIVFAFIELLGISAFVNILEEKGYEGKRGTVWLLGIFCTIAIAGLYVAALPDKYARPADINSPRALSAIDDELPRL